MLADAVGSENYQTNGQKGASLQQFLSQNGKQSLPKKSIFDFKEKKMNNSREISSLNSTIKGLPKWATKLKQFNNS